MTGAGITGVRGQLVPRSPDLMAGINLGSAVLWKFHGHPAIAALPSETEASFELAAPSFRNRGQACSRVMLRLPAVTLSRCSLAL